MDDSFISNVLVASLFRAISSENFHVHFVYMFDCKIGSADLISKCSSM